MNIINTILNRLLTHPAWTGVGVIVAILALVIPLFNDDPEPCVSDSLLMGGYSTWRTLSMPPSGKATYWWKDGLIVLGIWSDKTGNYIQHNIEENKRVVLLGQV